MKPGTLLGLGLAVGAMGIAGRLRRWGDFDWEHTRPTELGRRGTALVTGASSGIGAEYARRLAALGYDLILTARRESRLQELAAELSSAHAITTSVIAADLAVPDDVARLETVIAEQENLDVLVNNAGYGQRGKFWQNEWHKEIKMVEVHIIATIRLTRAALPGMLARGHGAIVNVSSLGAYFPGVTGVTYGPTKAYLNAFSLSLQNELRGTGVRIQALCPGLVLTEFHDTPELTMDRSQFPDVVWLTPQQVVRDSLGDLAHGGVICVPSWRYKLAALVGRSGLYEWFVGG